MSIDYGYMTSFLTPTEREELDRLVKRLEKATGKEKRRIKKRIKDFEDDQLDQVQALIANDDSGSLRAWFESFVDLDPDSDTFLSELDDATLEANLKETQWWLDEGTDYERSWYFKKYQPGNDNETAYESFEQDATDNLRNVLGQLGIDPDTIPPEDYEAFTDIYYGKGYDRPEQQSEFRKYVVSKYMSDEGADVVRNYGEELRDAAMRNGISRDNSWFLDAEKKIASGEMNLNAYTEQFRNEAMSRFPQFTEQLKAGEDLWDATSPWQSALKEVLEYEPTSMTDPNLLYAFESVAGDNGAPGVMPIYEYKKWLRGKPEWQETDNGRQTIDRVLTGIAKRMGVL